MMTLSKIAKPLQGELIGKDTTFTGVSIDTRTLTFGDIYIAIQGENFDGHDYIKQAMDNGACGAISAKPCAEAPVLMVKDTRIALGQLAHYWRQSFSCPIVGITGSCGKTTTKAMLAQILCLKAPTLFPERSLNNDIGVPLTLLKLTHEHAYAVIEMGANHKGEIAYVAQIAQPDVAILLNVAPVHLEGFKSLEGVATTKAEIFDALPKHGIGIIPFADSFTPYFKEKLQEHQCITFGENPKADVFATDVRLDEQGYVAFTLNDQNNCLPITLQLMGDHNVLNALAAACAAKALNIPMNIIQQGLNEFTAVDKRLTIYSGLGGARVIDDSYNANPQSVAMAMQVLAREKGQRIFIFADMAELGEEEVAYHEAVGKEAKEQGIDALYCYGKLSQHAAQAFGEEGHYFEDKSSLVAALKPQLTKQTTILIKGSNSQRMWEVTEAIKA